jgi:PadR family transcriptional regulator PadR
MARTLGELEQLILFSIVRLGAEAYGLNVWRELEERAGKTVGSGAVYTALDRLEKRGLISSSMGEPTAERGGRRKRHYQLKREGAELLHRVHRSLMRMADGVEEAVERMAQGRPA